MVTDTLPADLASTIRWMTLPRGILAVLFGAGALVWPGITVWGLTMVFGIYAITDGVTSVVSAMKCRRDGPWTWWVAGGVAAVVAGAMALAWPGITALVLLYVIACYAIVSGLFGAVGALEVRTLTGRRWMLAACLLAVLCGVFLLLAPGAGILGIVTAVGGYAIVVGAVLIVGAVQLHS
ncbi:MULTISPECIES: HdeD family acid-resistance protein [unclassified Rhodococcus (in: high G+C Gram-positive bacteria)]|uniref:HdeD family acid-resistance protein n=1 Tax=unclassified Rhodococcus (in: high G+C Gram-positive bacteria) TaxID=192944 RepID=UPI0000233542|nr:DUF308 domain-containing protein [Rhodococcus sp. DK17]AAR90207.1 putative membrane protein [Rhodococcus sp. DK17]